MGPIRWEGAQNRGSGFGMPAICVHALAILAPEMDIGSVHLRGGGTLDPDATFLLPWSYLAGEKR